MTNRRAFLKGLLGVVPAGAAAPAVGCLAQDPTASGIETVVGRDYFKELGVEPFINALAPYSSLGGSQMWPEVMEAITYSMKRRARFAGFCARTRTWITHRVLPC